MRLNRQNNNVVSDDQRFIDEQEYADNKAAKLSAETLDLNVGSPYGYLAGSSGAFDYALSLIEPLREKTVLDCGCGSGWLSVYMARKGATVYGFDISSKQIEVCKRRAIANDVESRTTFDRVEAENIKYPAGYFDAIIGIGVLHHIDIEKSALELGRVLKRRGNAVFIEPLGGTFLLDVVIRDLILKKMRKKRSMFESSFHYGDLDKFQQGFSRVEYREFQLLAMLEPIVDYKISRVLHLDKIDERLLSSAPFLKRYCRLIVINSTK